MSVVLDDAPVRAPEPQHSFLALLPGIEARARAAFRALRRHHDREDAVAEVVARAWERFSAPGARTHTTAAGLAEPAITAVRTALAAPHY